jgi:hypothetical protein
MRRRKPARWRLVQAIAALPLTVRALVGAALIVIICATVNWVYQVIRKPTEVFFPVSGGLFKTPAQTWRQYGPLFREYSTAVITADLLAALAQVEGEGNPVAQTYWRWQLTRNPFDLYRPASSAVGMYQITDATFGEARRYCIKDHVVVEDGPWHDVGSCWFNSLYTRVLPSHAIELTAARLDRAVAYAISRQRFAAATLQQKQDLAAVIHLCGARAGKAYARGGYRIPAHQRCGEHDARAYVAKVNAMKRFFARLAAAM